MKTATCHRCGATGLVAWLERDGIPTCYRCNGRAIEILLKLRDRPQTGAPGIVSGSVPASTVDNKVDYSKTPAAEKVYVSCTFCGWTGPEGEPHSCHAVHAPSWPDTSQPEDWVAPKPAAEPGPAPLPSADEFVAQYPDISWSDDPEEEAAFRGELLHAIRRRDAQHAAARQAVDVAALARDIWTTQAAGPWVFERVIRRHLGAGSGEVKP